MGFHSMIPGRKLVGKTITPRNLKELCASGTNLMERNSDHAQRVLGDGQDFQPDNYHPEV